MPVNQQREINKCFKSIIGSLQDYLDNLIAVLRLKMEKISYKANTTQQELNKIIEELLSKKAIDRAQYDQIKEMVTIEDVVLTGEAKDVDYMTKLGLMKGHLLVAKELLDLKLL